MFFEGCCKFLHQFHDIRDDVKKSSSTHQPKLVVKETTTFCFFASIKSSLQNVYKHNKMYFNLFVLPVLLVIKVGCQLTLNSFDGTILELKNYFSISGDS